MSTRKVSIYTGAGTGTREVETDAGTWDALRNHLSTLGVNLNGTTAVVGETETTLESGGAMLPNQDFTLFLLPSKVRSGKSL